MLKAGIIGVGSIGTKSHEAAMSRTDLISVTAVADIREDAAQEVAKRNNAKAYTDYRDLLASDVDVVFICTPPDLHVQMGIDVAKAGKHLFIEKPVALSMESALQLKEAVDKAGIRCQAGYIIGFSTGPDTMRRVLRSGKVGKLVSIMNTRIGNSDYPRKDVDTYRDWITKKARSGGVLIECFTHEIAWMVSVGGKVDTVYANLQRTETDPRIDIDDNHWGILNFKNGGMAAFGGSWANPAESHGKSIMGQTGALTMERGDTPRSSKIVYQDRFSDYREEIEAVMDADTPNKPEHFARCIMSGAPNFNTLDDAIYNLQVMLAMHKSTQENALIRVDDML